VILYPNITKIQFVQISKSIDFVILLSLVFLCFLDPVVVAVYKYLLDYYNYLYYGSIVKRAKPFSLMKSCISGLLFTIIE
jgi:hypothetical protein